MGSAQKEAVYLLFHFPTRKRNGKRARPRNVRPALLAGALLMAGAAALETVQDTPSHLAHTIAIIGLIAVIFALSTAQSRGFPFQIAATGAWLLAGCCILFICLTGLAGWGYGWAAGCTVAAIRFPAEPVPSEVKSAVYAALAFCCLHLQSAKRT